MRAIETARPEVQEALEYILDVFGGGDGGGSFVNLCCSINRWTAEESEKPAAEQLLNIIIQFSRLVKAAQPQRKGT
jgi:hypothetical protein